MSDWRTKMKDKVQKLIDELEREKGAEFACNVLESAMSRAISKYKSGSGDDILFGLVAQEMEKMMAE